MLNTDCVLMPVMDEWNGTQECGKVFPERKPGTD